LKTHLLLAIVSALLLTGTSQSGAAGSQGIAGDWQGTLTGPGIRISVHFDAIKGGGLTGKLYVVDQSADAFHLNSVTQDGANVAFTFDGLRLKYTGVLDATGTHITGTWNQGAGTPLDLQRVSGADMWSRDASPHKVSFVEVDKGVRLEVLDWGGTGRPIVLLAGLGNTAHVFDKLAPKLTATYHVYGITRRGFGESDAPAFNRQNYAADRLGDDVLAVMTRLGIERPVLIGHSIAGAELSSIGSRYPDRVAGLVYLEAGYSQGFYDRAAGDGLLDGDEVAAELEALNTGATSDPRALAHKLIDVDLPRLRKDLEAVADKYPPAGAVPPQPNTGPTASTAILSGLQKYTAVPVPILAIYAIPHDPGDAAPKDPAARAAAEAADVAAGVQANAFAAGLPSAKVLRIRARHYVFQSNEAEVLQAVRDFIAGLSAKSGR
jgi:pimeloyl-ACP methyl ester carboxylesterase